MSRNDDRTEHVKRFAVHVAGRIRFVNVADIDWIESAGDYARLHLGDQSHLIRTTMKNLERQLDPSVFVRIHRSTIVRIDRIAELDRLFHGDYLVTLESGEELRMSRRFKRVVGAKLGFGL